VANALAEDSANCATSAIVQKINTLFQVPLVA
jgi:hypothetical protein